MSGLKFNKQVIYRMKMRYGQPVCVLQLESHSTDVESGAKSVVLAIHQVQKACVLTISESRMFVYDLAFISANKDFTAGGFFDPEDRNVFIDADDLSYVPEVGDFVHVGAKTYMIRKVDDTLGYIYRLDCKRMQGAANVFAVNAHSALLVANVTSNVLTDRLTRSVSSVLSLTDSLVENP